MLRTVYTFHNQLVTVVSHFSFRRVIISIEIHTLYPVEFYRILLSIRSIGQQQTTLQVIEAKSFPRKFNCTVTTILVHKLLVICNIG